MQLRNRVVQTFALFVARSNYIGGLEDRIFAAEIRIGCRTGTSEFLTASLAVDKSLFPGRAVS
jgi:hypothetical protein